MHTMSLTILASRPKISSFCGYGMQHAQALLRCISPPIWQCSHANMLLLAQSNHNPSLSASPSKHRHALHLALIARG